MFDELLIPSPSVDFPVPEVVAPINEAVAPKPAVSTGSPSSTTIDQDAPSPSNSQTTPETQPLVIPNDVEEDNHDIEVAHMGNDPFFGIPIPEVISDQSSSSDIIHTIVHPDHQIFEHTSKWTKDHPLKNIIGELDRPVSTRLQLYEQALFLAYKLELPEELSNVYSTFDISNIKKRLSDESLVIPMKELRVDDKLNFVEEPVEIMDWEVKQLKQSRIPIVKVRWNFKRGPKFT
ncbi:hypothetical protein Tco_0110564 [Tanacetum coccineum]